MTFWRLEFTLSAHLKSVIYTLAISFVTSTNSINLFSLFCLVYIIRLYCFYLYVLFSENSDCECNKLSRSWILFQNFYFTPAHSRGRNASRRLMWNYGRVAFFLLFFFIVFRSCYIDTRDLRPAGRILCKILKDVLYPIYERDRMTHAGETLYCHPMLPLNANVRHRLNRSSILSFSLTPSPFFPFPLPFLVL